MAESEEELKSLFMKMKEESEKVGLKLNIQSFKSTFSLSSFTFIKRLFSSSSLSAIRVVSSAYLKLVRESFPRQVDKKSRGPQGERGLEFSRRKKGQTFFSFFTFLRIT